MGFFDERLARLGIRKRAFDLLLRFKLAANKPKLYFLIGPPAVGKSTWISQNANNAVVANRDSEVEAAAQETGVGTYDDMFVRPSVMLDQAGLTMPDKELVEAAANGDQEAKNQVDSFIAGLNRVAEEYQRTASPQQLKQYGKIIPFDFNDLKTVLVDYGVPSQYIVPFEYENVRAANELADDRFNKIRSDAVQQGQDLIIDMTNMNKSSRDSHRKHIVAAKEGSEGAINPANVNDYYDQVAVVFAPEEGYSDEMKAKVKQIARMRAEEIKAAGGAKTIPDSAYDRMFAAYQPPTPDEGFSDIIYVGVPSLGKMISASDRLLSKLNRLRKT